MRERKATFPDVLFSRLLNAAGYLTVLMPRIHGVSPLVNLFLHRRQLVLQELPHDVHVAAIQPVVIDGNGVLLQESVRTIFALAALMAQAYD